MQILKIEADRRNNYFSECHSLQKWCTVCSALSACRHYSKLEIIINIFLKL